MMKLDLGNI